MEQITATVPETTAKRIRKRPVKAAQQAVPPTIVVVPEDQKVATVEALPEAISSSSMSYQSPDVVMSDSQKDKDSEKSITGSYEETSVRKTPSTMIVTPRQQRDVELPTSLIDKQFRELLQADTKKAIQEAIAAIMTQHLEEKKLRRQQNIAKRKTVRIQEQDDDDDMDSEDDGSEIEEQIDTSSKGPLQYAAAQYEQEQQAAYLLRQQYHAPAQIPREVQQQRAQRRLALQKQRAQPPQTALGHPLATPSRFSNSSQNQGNASAFYRR